MKIVYIEEREVQAGKDFPAGSVICTCGCARRWIRGLNGTVYTALTLATQSYRHCDAIEEAKRRAQDVAIVQVATEEAMTQPIN